MNKSNPPPPPVKPNLPYCCSHNLLIKLVEMACLIVAVVLISLFSGPPAITYVQIVGALGAATCLAWIILFAFNFNARFPDFFPILMFVYHAILALLTIGMCIACGVLLPQFKISLYPHFLISTITTFVASVLFIVDAMLNMLWWRSAVSEIITCPCSPWQYEVRM